MQASYLDCTGVSFCALAPNFVFACACHEALEGIVQQKLGCRAISEALQDWPGLRTPQMKKKAPCALQAVEGMVLCRQGPSKGTDRTYLWQSLTFVTACAPPHRHWRKGSSARTGLQGQVVLNCKVEEVMLPPLTCRRWMRWCRPCGAGWSALQDPPMPYP